MESNQIKGGKMNNSIKSKEKDMKETIRTSKEDIEKSNEAMEECMNNSL